MIWVEWIIAAIVIAGIGLTCYTFGHKNGISQGEQQLKDHLEQERLARLRRMHDANRVHMPREDAGPNVKMHNIRFR